MAYDTPKSAPNAPGNKGGLRIAVVGAGISGLSAAWSLSKTNEVTLFEQDDRPGGHANTVDIDIERNRVTVDTGFIVYNEANYPNLVALFAHLGVETAASDMSFGASLRGGACEYSGQTLGSVFATRSNMISPRFWRMLIDVTRFHRLAKRALDRGVEESLSLGDFIRNHRLSKAFADDFIGPMAGAIWSTPCADVLDYPARSFLQFYANHGLLQVLNMPLWRTVAGGSRHYVQTVLDDFDGTLRLRTPVARVEPAQGGTVVVTTADGTRETFDHCVIAAHGDQARAMVNRPGTPRDDILAAFRYQPNRAVLHMDASAMPRQRAAWSAWNVIEAGDDLCVTYWMNKLQPLATDRDVFVTLNPPHPLNPVFGQWDYVHPLYDLDVYRAQRDIWAHQGTDNIWFAGAHLGAGFHEDGLQAGLKVAEAISDVARPWQVENASGRLNLERFRPSDRAATHEAV
ncbi:MAG: FAD-dependent oxidoreductase [Pseudomonadota bacterium]